MQGLEADSISILKTNETGLIACLVHFVSVDSIYLKNSASKRR